jgi:hypothetical protein
LWQFFGINMSNDMFARVAEAKYPHKVQHVGNHFRTLGDVLMHIVLGILIPPMEVGKVYHASALWETVRLKLEYVSPSLSKEQNTSVMHLMSNENKCFWMVMAHAHKPWGAIVCYQQRRRLVVSIHGRFHQVDESEVVALSTSGGVDAALGDAQPSVPLFLSPFVSNFSSVSELPFESELFTEADEIGEVEAIVLPSSPRTPPRPVGRAFGIDADARHLEGSLPTSGPSIWQSRFDHTGAIEDYVKSLEVQVADCRSSERNATRALGHCEYALENEKQKCRRMGREIGSMVKANQVPETPTPTPETPTKTQKRPRAPRQSLAERQVRGALFAKEVVRGREANMAVMEAKKADRDAERAAKKQKRGWN